jgi:hypothetical protein
MKTFRAITTLLCAVALTACEKNAVQEIAGPATGARIRFFNLGVNAPGVNFYANDRKMTAISSVTGVESTTGTVYGGVGSSGFYSVIEPGSYTISGKIAAATDKNVAISSVPATLVDGKSYSFYLSGIYNATTKTADGFVVEDQIAESIDYTMAYVRFVNAISNASPMTLYARNTTTLTEMAIGGAVPYKSAGAFTAVPTGVYDLSTRFAGASTSAIARTAVSFSAGRIYTISARGDMTVTSTTAATRPFLDNTANR